MFEDALLESSGRIRTRGGWFSGVATLINGSVLALLLLLPLLHPASLPKQTLSMPLIAPQPPAAPVQAEQQPTNPARVVAQTNPFQAPIRIPKGIPEHESPMLPPESGLASLSDATDARALEGIADALGTAAPPVVHVARPQRVAISSGVMAGNRIAGEAPRYPAIARAARIDGVVTLAATIAKSGAIENLRVVSGPPLLTAAAIDAVRTWRYRPYLLNGDPVEVETTVRVVFHLGE